MALARGTGRRLDDLRMVLLLSAMVMLRPAMVPNAVSSRYLGKTLLDKPPKEAVSPALFSFIRSYKT